MESRLLFLRLSPYGTVSSFDALSHTTPQLKKTVVLVSKQLFFRFETFSFFSLFSTLKNVSFSLSLVSPVVSFADVRNVSGEEKIKTSLTFLLPFKKT